MINGVLSAAFFGFFIATLIGFIREDSIMSIVVRGLSIYLGILGLGFAVRLFFKQSGVKLEDFRPNPVKPPREIDIVVRDQSRDDKAQEITEIQQNLSRNPQIVAKTLKEMLKK